ncbi:MAG: ribosome-associated translation inhibitor RaiA [Gammaproteobacteria bacterium]|nr:MAG: ribosome-associated translation inhibitor RaiA [Gammaproteobacteria bacterium]
MLPVQITVRDFDLSPAVEDHIRKRAEKLTRVCRRVSSCRVVIELPQKHKHQGKLYNVRLDITVPGKELAVTRKCDEDIYVAIRDAFNAVERQLEEHSHIRQGRVKTHHHVMHGYVARLIAKEGYGFIRGVDGTEYYFSITNVHYPHFNQLLVGDAVEYTAEAVNEGWQAHHVVRERYNNHAEL